MNSKVLRIAIPEKRNGLLYTKKLIKTQSSFLKKKMGFVFALKDVQKFNLNGIKGACTLPKS